MGGGEHVQCRGGRHRNDCPREPRAAIMSMPISLISVSFYQSVSSMRSEEKVSY